MALVLSAAVVTLSSSACAQKQPNKVERIVRKLPAPSLVASRTPSPRPVVVRRSSTPAPHRPDVVARSDSEGELVQMSWYDQGTRTASGEALNPSGLTCAGASRFPMLSHWRLSNPRTGAAVVIKVNDRGAFEGWGRSFDCVPGVWRALGFDLGSGVVTVAVSAA